MPLHLTKGSKEPPLQNDKVRLYSMIFCPYAHRAHLILIAKNVPYEPVFINLTEKPEWYTQSVPTGKVPALNTEGTVLYESLIISDYLDEKYEGRKLSSDNPLQKALDRLFIESFKVPTNFYRCFVEKKVTDDIFAEILTSLQPVEKELVTRGTKFLGGNNPGMIDYMLWPWIERLDVLPVLGGSQYVIPKDQLPRLVEYIDDMKNDKVVKTFYIPPEKYAEFFKRRIENAPNQYDIELEIRF